MAKNYTLEKSQTTGWWMWECADGETGGSAPNKSDARAQARKSCVQAAGIIFPPNVDIIAYRGYLASFSVKNLDGKLVTFSTEEISQAKFSFFFGLPCANDEKIEEVQKVITILKIWGIYRGGLNEESVKKFHFLSTDDYKRLSMRKYYGGKICIEDDDTISWNLPK